MVNAAVFVLEKLMPARVVPEIETS